MTKSILIGDGSQVFRRTTRGFVECHTRFGVCGNGLQAARAIRRISSVPIILFTLYAEAVGAQDVLSVGIDAVIPKAGNLSLLGKQVNLLLSNVQQKKLFAGGRPEYLRSTPTSDVDVLNGTVSAGARR